MKKLIGLFLVIALLIFSCEKDNSFEQMIGSYECTVYVRDTINCTYTIVNPTIEYYNRCVKVRTVNGEKVYEIWKQL